MGFVEEIIAWVVGLIMGLIQAIGYLGIVGLMALESMCLPVPSEIVLPFGGALVAMGKLAVTGNPAIDTLLIGVAGTIGCTIGSIIAYYIGLKGGRPLILRYGRYIRLNEGHLDLTERWFKKYGNWAVFGSRLLPVVRTFISLPAGMAKMEFKSFVVLTTAGSLPWCVALAYIGYVLGENWAAVESLYRPMEILVVIAIAAYIVYYLWRRRSAKKDSLPSKELQEE